MKSYPYLYFPTRFNRHHRTITLIIRVLIYRTAKLPTGDLVIVENVQPQNKLQNGVLEIGQTLRISGMTENCHSSSR